MNAASVVNIVVYVNIVDDVNIVDSRVLLKYCHSENVFIEAPQFVYRRGVSFSCI